VRARWRRKGSRHMLLRVSWQQLELPSMHVGPFGCLRLVCSSLRCPPIVLASILRMTDHSAQARGRRKVTRVIFPRTDASQGTQRSVNVEQLENRQLSKAHFFPSVFDSISHFFFFLTFLHSGTCVPSFFFSCGVSPSLFFFVMPLRGPH
jgi:hypothetical protein